MKCRILFSCRNKKKIISLPSAELAWGVVMVKCVFNKWIFYYSLFQLEPKCTVQQLGQIQYLDCIYQIYYKGFVLSSNKEHGLKHL